jgi:flavin reductase (DIM6/NTAB) family NADH-FMN oxidoreductase RutF
MKQTECVAADKNWTEKNIRDFRGSPTGRIADEWMLVTAADSSGAWNTMTASWGGFGELWGRDVAFMFIRPTRYTLEFADKAEFFTLSFFGGKHQKALDFCGSKSGKDFNKAAETGLSPIVFGKDAAGGKINGAVGFAQASEIIVCKKLYTHDFDPSRFLDPSIDGECYPEKDYHRMFIGKITAMMVR